MQNRFQPSELIINFTPTGAIPTKEMTPHVPISVPEIVEDVHRAVELGITMVHLHARDPETGKPSYRAEIYGSMIQSIRSFAPDLIICVSLTGRNFSEFEKRSEPLQLTGDSKPDMGSLTLSSLNFNQQASVNTPDMIKTLAQTMMERRILPELEAFDSGMINYANYLVHKGLLQPPHYFNLIVGNIACAQADLMHMGIMINDLPPQSIWSLGGVGDVQFQVNAVGLVSGGGVRVGLEDNIWFDQQRTQRATNLDLLKRIHHLAEAAGRAIMAPASLRKRLNLEAGQGKYGRKTTST
jgi:uncharacterized protein (DUF849 family)